MAAALPWETLAWALHVALQGGSLQSPAEAPLHLHSSCLSGSHTDAASFVLFIHIPKRAFLGVDGTPCWGHLCHKARDDLLETQESRAATDTLGAGKSGDMSLCTMNRVPAQETPQEVGWQIQAYLAELNSG